MVQILGLRFFDGTVDEVVALMVQNGGVLIVPAAPALVRSQYDPIYRNAVTRADVAIPDSGLMVLAWAIVKGRKLRRISGLAYLQRLLQEPRLTNAGHCFFVLPNEAAKTKLLGWSEGEHRQIVSTDCYIAPNYPLAVGDPELLDIIRTRQPKHIIIGIGNGPQEKLGVYLRDNLSYRPAIHCIGAALGFITGEQVAIPEWADRFYLGWLLRLFAQPKIFVPRLARATKVPWLILRYGENLPPLRNGV